MASLPPTFPYLMPTLWGAVRISGWNIGLPTKIEMGLRTVWWKLHNSTTVFTARCTLVQSAVLRSHVVRPSVCLSVPLVDCDHIGSNSSKLISPLVSLGCSLFANPAWRVCSKGNTPKFGPKVTHPLLIWASETIDRKLRPNGYR